MKWNFRRYQAALAGGIILLNSGIINAHPAYAGGGWGDVLAPIVKEVIVPGVTKGVKIWKEKQDEKKESTSSTPSWQENSDWEPASSTPVWSDAPSTSSSEGWTPVSSTATPSATSSGWVPAENTPASTAPPPPPESTPAPVWSDSYNHQNNAVLIAASTDTIFDVGGSIQPYEINESQHVINVYPAGNATNSLNSALDYLIKRADKSTHWTMNVAGGKYFIDKSMYADKLENVSLVSDPANPAIIVKSPSFSQEYVFYARFAHKVEIRGFEFYGKTEFKYDAEPVWGDQGVYFGSGKDILIKNNKFYNFGNGALRVTTSESDPTTGVNSFNTTVQDNEFNNVYQITTTSNDTVHGATANYIFENNKIYNLKGSVKFATRTPGAKNVKIINNVINGSARDGFEICSYTDLEMTNNRIENIKQHALNIYTNNRADKGFPWGSNFVFRGNTIRNTWKAFRFSADPYDDGYQPSFSAVILDQNTIEKTTNATYAPIMFLNGPVNNTQIINNRFNSIASSKYYDFPSSSSNMTVYGNLVDNAAYDSPAPSTSPDTPPPQPSGTTAPEKPSNVTSQLGMINNQAAIKLNWQDNAGNETGQEIWISSDAKNYALLTRLGANVTSHIHNIGSSPKGPYYYYKLRAYNEKGASGFTSESKSPTTVSGETGSTPDNSNTGSTPVPTEPVSTAPEKPSNVTSQGGMLNNQPAIRLEWQDNASNESGQEIWISADAKQYALLTRLGANITSYVHNIGSSPKAPYYYYKLRSYNKAGASGFTDEHKSSTAIVSLTPAKPGNLAAQLGNMENKPAIKLSWSDNASNETGQEVWISNDARQYYLLTRLAANETSYFHTFETAKSPYYYYKVRAYNEKGFSSFGNEARVATQ